MGKKVKKDKKALKAVEGYQGTVVKNILRETVKSPQFLIAMILYTLCVVPFVFGFVSLLYAFLFDKTQVDSSILVCLFNLPTLLVAVGLWRAFLSATQKADGSLDKLSSGIKMVETAVKVYFLVILPAGVAVKVGEGLSMTTLFVFIVVCLIGLIPVYLLKNATTAGICLESGWDLKELPTISAISVFIFGVVHSAFDIIMLLDILSVDVLLGMFSTDPYKEAAPTVLVVAIIIGIVGLALCPDIFLGLVALRYKKKYNKVVSGTDAE